MSKQTARGFFLTLGTFALLVITHNLSTLLHEWTHGTLAYFFGYKDNPFDIAYGKFYWSRLEFADIDENVPYQTIFSEGKGYAAGWIAFSPQILAILLILLGFKLLHSGRVQEKKWHFAFWYWFTLMNLGQIWDYIPIRVFSPTADMANFEAGFNISPWVVFIIGTLVVGVGIWRFFFVETALAYQYLGIKRKWIQRVYLFVALFLLFCIPFGASGFTQPFPIAHFFSWVSLALIPILFFVLNRLVIE